MSKLSVAVLFGGVSSEHEISKISAASVLSNIDKEKYDVHMIGITKKGQWYYFSGNISEITSGEWESNPDNVRAVISPDRDIHGILLFQPNKKVERIDIDVCFPVMHGRNGEDGRMQGLLDLAGIPYVGCDLPSSAICMDKALTNTILEQCGIKQANFIWFTDAQFSNYSEKYIDRIERELGYPCFVKPANAGSSVGISKATSRVELCRAIGIAAANDDKIVVEESIKGAEVEVAVLGNTDIKVSVVGEIAPANDWYDFEAKYSNADSKLYIPARISDEKQKEVQNAAIEAYKALGCSGLTRMDFFIRESDGAVLLNEPNTIPGFTSISMYPKLWEASGVTYQDLIDVLINLAIERTDSK